MHSENQIVAPNRYPGVKPFSVEQRELFFGREKETDEFFDLVMAREMVVFFGKSGYGKSSLINAGIIPKLETETNYKYQSIRFTNYNDKDTNSLKPQEILSEKLKEFVSKTNYSFPELLNVTDNEQSLWYWLKTIQWYNEIDELILFFDQFEELFTYPTEDIEHFSAQLAEMLYTPIPIKYRQNIATLKKAGQISSEFYNFLNAKPNPKLVFSVRSDRLSQLNTLNSRHYAILSNCYELLPISEEEAKNAIIRPAQMPGSYASDRFTYTEDAIESILNEISDEQTKTVETPVLQIICRFIEDKLVVARKLTVIQKEDLGDIAGVFLKHYEDALKVFNKEDGEKVQELIEEKLISGNQRNSLSELFIKQEFGINDLLLQKLEQSSVLRKERDASGRLLYEISHDSLVEPILDFAQNRLKRKEKERQLAFKKQVIEEKRRVSKLRRLSTFAILGLIIAAIAAMTAFSFYKKANDAQRQTQRALARAEQTLNNLDYQKAKELFTKANQYFEYEEYELARKSYQEANKYLQGRNENNSEIINEKLRTDLEKAILEGIENCKKAAE